MEPTRLSMGFKMNEQKKLNLFICSNYYREYKTVIEQEGFNDVCIKPFGCMCENKRVFVKNQKLLGKHIGEDQSDNIMISSRYCEINKIIPDNNAFTRLQSDFCFSHFASKQYINQIIEEGSYVIGLNWLSHWHKNIEIMGFDQKTARLFFGEFASQLVFFNANIEPEAEKHLQELSAYLGLPYVMIPLDLEYLAIYLRSIVFEWRLQRNQQKNDADMKAIQTQCAEYSTILNLMVKLTSVTTKRDVLEKTKNIFLIVLGGQSFKYWNIDYKEGYLAAEVEMLLSDHEKSYSLKSQENKFYIRLEHNDQCFGVIEVGDFLFSQYLEKYLNFAIEIGNIVSLVLTNIEQYEKLVDSENKLLHLSYHDSLTGLYNRTYINNFLENNKMDRFLTIFMFDIDGLKFVNDTFGHLEGDKLITAASDIIQRCFRETDIVARIGGDEFMAVLPDCETEMAESFKLRLENMIRLHNQQVLETHLKISMSSGFAVTQRQIESIEALMRQADEKMYIEKREKKKGDGREKVIYL